MIMSGTGGAMRFAGLPEGVTRFAECHMRVVPGIWDYAAEHGAAIAAAWVDAKARHPHLFNGAILMLADVQIDGPTFRGDLIQTDFASFRYWRSAGSPDVGVRDGFGSGLIISADGDIVFGRQAPGNMNSGFAYPPGGFIDARDIAVDRSVDIAASIAREIEEETGLGADVLVREPGFQIAHVERQVSIGVVHRARLDSAALVARVRRHLASEIRPELEDVEVLRAGDALSATATPMPKFAVLHAEALLQRA
jgi:8-oxo-dGTP pyrophosphatase MutT (NUDIX family)